MKLRTERLLLRPFAATDFDAMLVMNSNADVVRYLYWEPRTADEVREIVERKSKYTTMGGPGDNLAFAVVLESSGELVGDCGLQWHDNDYCQGEIGFIVHPDHHGRGYATEAARAVLRVAFEEVRLHRVVGRTEARNIASARVLERLGMRREAHLIENEFVKGEWQSELVYAFLDREWRDRGFAGLRAACSPSDRSRSARPGNEGERPS